MKLYSHFLMQWTLVAVALLAAGDIPVSLAQDHHSKSHQEPNYRTNPSQAGNRVTDELSGNDHQRSLHGDVSDGTNARTHHKDADYHHSRQIDKDSKIVKVRDQTYHISKPKQREGEDHNAKHRNYDGDGHNDQRHAGSETQRSNSHQHQPKHSNHPPQDRLQNSQRQQQNAREYDTTPRTAENGAGNDLSYFNSRNDNDPPRNSRHEEKHPHVSTKATTAKRESSRTSGGSNLHDPTGDGNSDYNTKENDQSDNNSSRAAATTDDSKDKMPVVYGCVVFFLFVSLWQLWH